MNKYRNRKVKTSDGLIHDSIKELRRWKELQLLERAGRITDLKKQVKFVLIDKLEGQRKMAYFADFTYYENGEYIVEDTKSKPTKTDTYKIKKKLLFERYGIKIREIEK